MWREDTTKSDATRQQSIPFIYNIYFSKKTNMEECCCVIIQTHRIIATAEVATHMTNSVCIDKKNCFLSFSKTQKRRFLFFSLFNNNANTGTHTGQQHTTVTVGTLWATGSIITYKRSIYIYIYHIHMRGEREQN